MMVNGRRLREPVKKYGYMGGIDYTPPSYPKDWQTRRKAVLARCGHRCEAIRADTGQRCAQKATEVNHKGHRNDHSIGALEGLCRYHHQKYTSRQGNTAQASRRLNKPPIKLPQEFYYGPR